MQRLLSATGSRLLACAAPRKAAQRALGSRGYAAGASGKIPAAPMVYVAGEEMTRYTMDLILKRWIEPHVDTSAWEFFDLRAKNRDDTEDRVLRDVIAAGARLKAIFKEPTITPTADQVKRLGLKKAWGSPNGAMRRGWNGITISRDTIHIDGVDLGYKRPVFFERHAVGGEYSAGYKIVGKGQLKTTFVPEGGGDAIVVDDRAVVDDLNAVVTYHNPLDNVNHLARIFFGRCLDAGIVPYVVTKKTVFKWQEPFWETMKRVFDDEFKENASKLLQRLGNKDKMDVVMEEWKAQFTDAIQIPTEEDDPEAKPSKIAMFMHVLVVFWKVLFATVPPVRLGGGWPAFFVALVYIGGMTVGVSDLCGLFGCVLSCPPAITAITCQPLRVTSIRFASLQRLNTDHSRVILAAHGQTALNPTHTGHLD